MNTWSRVLLALALLAAAIALLGGSTFGSLLPWIACGVLFAAFVVSWILGLARGTARPNEDRHAA